MQRSFSMQDAPKNFISCRYFAAVYVDSQAKTFLILYPRFENSIAYNTEQNPSEALHNAEEIKGT